MKAHTYPSIMNGKINRDSPIWHHGNDIADVAIRRHRDRLRAKRQPFSSDKDLLCIFLTQHKIGTAIYYPLPLHLQPCFKELGGKPGDCPAAEAAANETLALPVYPELTSAQQSRIVTVISEFMKTHV